MQIDIKGRNTPVTDELRRQIERRLAKVARQVSDLARLEVEVFQERNPAIAESQVVETTLYLKGVTLRASERSHDLGHAARLACDDLARQVKRHRDKRRRRRVGRPAETPGGPSPAI